MRVLITGTDGFVGSHLAEYLLSINQEVFGTRQIHSNIEFNNLPKYAREKIKIYDCDLRDRASVYRVLKDCMPDKIFHLAAQSFVRSSWDNPEYTIYNNVFSQLNIFETCKNLNLFPIIQIAGSSEEYGNQNIMPIRETAELLPISPYAVSKVCQEKMAYQYFKSYGLRTVLTRAFNHEGPRRGTQFVTSNFAKQFAEMSLGIKEQVLEVGNLEAERDYTDVRDMVKAYWLATEKCEYGEPYNICSMNHIKISKIIDILKKVSGLEPKIIQDPARMRPSDLQVLYGDNSKFVEATGWKPEIDFYQTMKDLYIYHLENKL